MTLERAETVEQKAAWRARLIVDVISRRFDDETLGEMIDAGLRQAHAEGIQDAAFICEEVASKAEKSSSRYVSSVIANALHELNKRNRKTDAAQ